MNLFDEIDTLDLRFKNRAFSIREFKEKHADVIAEFMASLRPIEPKNNIPPAPTPEPVRQKLIRKVKEHTRHGLSACAVVGTKIAAAEKNTVPRPLMILLLGMAFGAMALLK